MPSTTAVPRPITEPLSCQVVINVFPVYASLNSTPSPQLLSPPLLRAVTPAVNWALDLLPTSEAPDPQLTPLDLSVSHMPDLTPRPPSSSRTILNPPPTNHRGPVIRYPDWSYLADIQPISPPSSPRMMNFMSAPPADIKDLPVLCAVNIMPTLPPPNPPLTSDEFPEMMDTDQLETVIKSLDLDQSDQMNNNLPTSVDGLFSLLELPASP